MQIHHCLCHSIQQLLNKHKEIYLTKEEIQNDSPTLELFGSNTPDFLLKSNPTKGRARPLFIDTEKHRSPNLQALMDATHVQADTLLTDLAGLFPADDLIHLHCHMQVFMTEYYKSRVLMNTIVRIELPDHHGRSMEHTAQFADGMRAYALAVLDQSRI